MGHCSQCEEKFFIEDPENIYGLWKEKVKALKIHISNHRDYAPDSDV